jgi:hypothetical protein
MSSFRERDFILMALGLVRYTPGQIPIKPRRLSSTSEHRPHRFNNLVRHHDAYLHLIQIHIRLVLPVYTLSKSGTSRWNFLRSINIIAEADMSGQKAFRG